MTAFTIFRNAKTEAFAAVYNFALPTVTGIGVKEEWQPVYHGQATGLLDKARQCKEFAERAQTSPERPISSFKA